MKKQFTKERLGWVVLALGVYGLIVLLMQLGILNSYYQITLITIGINIILAVGLNLILGIAGQFSLGHAGFMSIGAYSCAIVTLRIPTIMGFLIGVVIGLVVATIAALIVAIPTLRLKGDYLAIATLGIAEIVRMVMVNGGTLTNGAAGLSNIPKLNNWTITYICIVLVILVTCYYVLSSPGRATVAVREDEIAAESVGINPTKYKTIAFVIGAMAASVAGSLYASYFSIIKPETFGFTKSIDILTIVVLGGIGSITGSVFAAILLGIVNTFLQSYGALRMIIYALILIGTMLFRPTGLLGRSEFTMSGLFNFFRKKQEKGE